MYCTIGNTVFSRAAVNPILETYTVQQRLLCTVSTRNTEYRTSTNKFTQLANGTPRIPSTVPQGLLYRVRKTIYNIMKDNFVEFE